MSKEVYKAKIIEQMRGLGTYKDEYEETINVFAGMLDQYNYFEEEFEKSGYKIMEEHTNRVGATNMRKVPLVGAMETLRKDIVTYSNALCLNPKSMNTQGKPDEEKMSSLESVLKQLG